MFLILSTSFEWCANNVPVKYFIFVQSLQNFLETSQNLSCQQCEGFNGAFYKTDNRAPLLVVPKALAFTNSVGASRRLNLRAKINQTCFLPPKRNTFARIRKGITELECTISLLGEPFNSMRHSLCSLS